MERKEARLRNKKEVRQRCLRIYLWACMKTFTLACSRLPSRDFFFVCGATVFKALSAVFDVHNTFLIRLRFCMLVWLDAAPRERGRESGVSTWDVLTWFCGPDVMTTRIDDIRMWLGS